MVPRHDSDRRRVEGLVALVVVQVFFGLFPLLVHVALDRGDGFSPRAIAVWRMAGAALVLGAFAFARHRRAFFPRVGDLPRFLSCALFGIVANQVLALEGVARTSITRAGLLMTTIPVFTYGLALMARQETFRPRRAAGIATALVGAVSLVLLRAGPAESGSDPVLGNALIVANCLSYAGYLILARRLLDRYPTPVVIAWLFLLALPVTPVIAWNVEVLPEVTGTARLGLLAVVLLPTIAAYFLNTYALARVSASTTAVFIYLQPFVAGVSGWLFRGERPGPGVLLAGGLLLVGLGLVVRGGTGVRAENGVRRGGLAR